jgi:hypothetical protein
MRYDWTKGHQIHQCRHLLCGLVAIFFSSRLLWLRPSLSPSPHQTQMGMVPCWALVFISSYRRSREYGHRSRTPRGQIVKLIHHKHKFLSRNIAWAPPARPRWHMADEENLFSLCWTNARWRSRTISFAVSVTVHQHCCAVAAVSLHISPSFVSCAQWAVRLPRRGTRENS